MAISSTAVPSDAGDPYLQSLADVRKVAERAPAAGPAGAAAVADDGPPIPPSRPPETLPPGPPVAAREERSSEAELLALAARAKPDPTLAAPGPRLARQTLPPGAAGLAPREEPRPAARFEADAGAPKPETDPVPALLAQLRSPDARARARAADELGKRGAAQVGVLAALRRALRDRVARVRAGAALALGNLGAGEAVADLARAARDKDEDVRWSATVALGRIKTPAARATFRRLVLRASS